VNRRPGSAPDSQALLLAARRGDARARARLIERNLPLVEAIARRYAGRGEQLDDLVQVGCIGLINAIDRFDVERGNGLSALAAPSIAGEIQRHLRDRCSPVRIPRRLQEQRLALTRAGRELQGRLGRAPTWAELAARAALAPDEVARTLESEHARAPLALAVSDGEEPGTARAPAALEDPIADAEMRATLFAALRRLGKRERRIVTLRYFRDLNQAEIAREVGLSQIQVSRLLRDALCVMRADLDEDTGRVAQRAASS
jgi:RNA polymerase sigma-B factor